ncbi:MAG: AAA family ATPase, partial [Pseudomonadota bacterium]
MPELAIELLGKPRLHLPDGGEEVGRFERTRLLLYYLAAHPGTPCRRERLADLLWGEADPAAARLNLRQALHKLRRLLGPASDALEVDRTTVTLHPGARCRVDVAELAGSDDPGVLEYWRGPFLDGYPEGAGREDYDAWVARQRRTLAEALRERLETGARALSTAGDAAGALALVRRHAAVLGGHRPVWLRELEAQAAVPPAPEGPVTERRPVTVVHLDPFGGKDPSAAGVAAAMHQSEAVLQRHGGHVVAFPGGGLVAYFGYPVASEHAPRQALRAALASCEFPGLRAGVAGGITLTTVRGEQPDVAGNVAGLACDLALEANPGEVRVAPELAAALDGPFHFESSGTALRLTGEAGRSAWLEAAARRAAGRPLLEREGAMDQLMAAWEQARAGEGQVVAIRGDAGVGKTRLLLALRARLHEEAALVRELVCDPLDRHQPLGPALDLLRRLLPSYGGGVRDLLRTWGVAADPETVAALQGLVAGSGAGPSTGEQREAILELLADTTAAAAEHHPSAWFIDDLQWMDPSSRDLLDRFLDRLPGRRLLLVLSGRPGAPFPDHAATTVEPAPLTADGARALVRSGSALSSAAEERVLTLAGGNPLYLEEFARQAAEGGGDLPQGIRDQLAAVVDGYAGQRELSRLAAVAGHAFPGELIAAASGDSRPEPEAGLAELAARGLLHEDGEGGFYFRHALLREALLAGTPWRERRELAGRLAIALVERLPERARMEPARLAHYHELAGATEAAAAAWCDAGVRALEEAAWPEAEDHLL